MIITSVSFSALTKGTAKQSVTKLEAPPLFGSLKIWHTLVLSCQDFTLLEHRLHTGLAIHYLTTLTFEEELVIFSCNYDCIIAGYNCNFAYVTSCTSDSNLTGKIHSKTLDLISQISADFINSQKLIFCQVHSQFEHFSGDWPLCVTIL